MKKNSKIIIIAVLLIVVVLLVYFTYNKKGGNYSDNNSVSQNNTQPQLFSSSPFSQYAYLISAPTYDADTEKALTGFKVTKKTLTDGSVQITLTAQNPEYKTQTYVVKTGEKLYFVEKFLGDDVGTEEKSLRDDTAVLVDADGYIVNQ
jgi:hypothetical protein